MPLEIAGAIIVLVVTVVTLLARQVKVADPILLVVGGAALALVPSMPRVEVDADLLLLVVLPPMLLWHAFIVTPREIRSNALSIGILSVGLVLLTICAVAVVAHYVIGFSWAAAVTLGAILGPTDPVAFLTVARRLDVSPRLVGLLDGENLLNDFTALTVYFIAIDAVVFGDFSTAAAGLSFLVSATAGIAIGVVVGFIVSTVNAKVHEANDGPHRGAGGCIFGLPAS